MRTFLIALAALLVAPAVASAGTIEASTSVQGGGKIVTPGTDFALTHTCGQPPVVSGETFRPCPDGPWTAQGEGDVKLDVAAFPAPGWQFAGWTGCPAAATFDVVCRLAATGSERLRLDLRARFVDVTPPARVDGLEMRPGKNWWGNAIFSPTWSESEPALTYRCTVDDAAPYACNPGKVLASPGEGEHTFTVVAVDPSGNQGPARTVGFLVLETWFTTAPAVYTRAPEFAVTSGYARDFECSVDGSPYFACGHAERAGERVALKIPELAEGGHRVYARARHGQTVDEAPPFKGFYVDRTPPQTIMTATATGFTLTSDDIYWPKYRCRLDGGALYACSSTVILAGLAPGQHTFLAYATDEAGNADPTPAAATWTVS